MPLPIVEIDVSIDSNLQPGWTRLPVDCNAGAGGGTADIFIDYKRGSPGAAGPIVALDIVEGDAPAGFTKIDKDLNKGAGGAFLFLCYKRATTGDPIIDLLVRAYDDALTPDKVPPGYGNVNGDMNKGAGGDFVYLFSRNGPIEKTPFKEGIPGKAMANSDHEYEIDMVQLGNQRRLVRLQRLEIVDQLTIAKDIPFQKTFKFHKGVKSEIVKKVHEESEFGGEFTYNGFTAKVNQKLQTTLTTTYSAVEEVTIEESFSVPAVGFDRTLASCVVVDILRVISVPFHDTKAEAISRSVIRGYLLTNEQGKWVPVES